MCERESGLLPPLPLFFPSPIHTATEGGSQHGRRRSRGKKEETEGRKHETVSSSASAWIGGISQHTRGLGREREGDRADISQISTVFPFPCAAAAHARGISNSLSSRDTFSWTVRYVSCRLLSSCFGNCAQAGISMRGDRKLILVKLCPDPFCAGKGGRRKALPP